MKKRNIIESYEYKNGTKYTILKDIDTEEVIDIIKSKSVNDIPKRKFGGSETYKHDNRLHFIKLYRTNIIDLIKHKNLNINEMGLLFICISFIGWETNYLINPYTDENLGFNELVDLTGYSRQTLQDLLQRLNEKGLIAIVKRGKGCSNHYQINSNISFWGKKIKDINEHLVFSKGCAYTPKIDINYQERDKDK